MSTNGDAAEGAARGDGGRANDGLKGLAFKAGTVDLEHSSAVWTGKAESKPAAAGRPPEAAKAARSPPSQSAPSSLPAKEPLPPASSRPGWRDAQQRLARWGNMVLLAAVCLLIVAGGWRLYRDHLSGRVEATASPAAVPGADRAEIRQAQQLLEQERARSKELDRQLAARQAELEALQRARSKDLEQYRADRQNDQGLLAQERARSQALEQELSKRADALSERARTATQMPVPAGDSAPAPPTPVAREAAAPPPTPTLPQATENAEAVRLMARAKLLLELGDVSAARIVLERAVEAGSPLAEFALAETYDQAVLSAWRTFGTQGDDAKAQQLYAKAAEGGVEAAKDRLKTPR